MMMRWADKFDSKVRYKISERAKDLAMRIWKEDLKLVLQCEKEPGLSKRSMLRLNKLWIKYKTS
jgi:hypothetical protein